MRNERYAATVAELIPFLIQAQNEGMEAHPTDPSFTLEIYVSAADDNVTIVRCCDYHIMSVNWGFDPDEIIWDLIRDKYLLDPTPGRFCTYRVRKEFLQKD